MAEPHPHANRLPADAEGAPSVPPVPAEAPPLALTAPLSASPPTDDTPTIISKNTPPALRTDGDLAESLRGRSLAHFELLEPIGVGGMAAVIRARDTQLDRIVALKVLPPDMAADPENIRRFHQEARSAAKLDHENIARVFYCGQDQALLFIAFEYVEGENLRTILERRGRLPVTEAIHYVLQIATGLAHAAARGVVHRDIKPSNIIVAPSGRAKLVDMGLARSLGPQPDGGLTQSGVTLGTFDYISPEQALEPRDADVRSDIYSLGCTFYHMLTGQPPVPEGTAAKKLHHHQHVPPLDPRQVNPAIPDEVAATLARMMAKDPGERYQQPEHLVQHLLLLARNVGAPTSAPDGVLFVDAPLPAPPHMRPAFLMAAAVVLLVAFIVFFGSTPEPAGTPRGGNTRIVPNNGGEPAVVQNQGGTSKATVSAADKGQGTPAPTALPRQAGPFVPESARELADYLAKNQVADVLLTRDLDLTKEGVQLVFQGRELNLSAAQASRPPTIRLDYPLVGGSTRWAALTVRGSGRVNLTGVRFVVDATAADIFMSAIACEGTGQVAVQQCEFIPLNPPDSGGRGRLSAISIAGIPGEGEVPDVRLTQCYFAPGQEAVALHGAARVRAKQCAFAPQTAALFALHGRCRLGSELRLEFCSAFLTQGAAFAVDEEHPCEIEANNSIFSCPETDSPRPHAGVLLHCTGRPVQGPEYQGTGNCFHNLRAYLVRSSPVKDETITRLEDFKKDQQASVRDSSLELSASPWEAADPLAMLRGENPLMAFRVKLTLPELRRNFEETPVVGVNVCAAGRLYERPLPRIEERKPPAVADRKIVDPNALAGNGVYRTLAEAVAGAKSGETIWIRHNGLLLIESVRPVTPNIELTIQAEPKYRPVLALSPSHEAESLFWVYDGKLTLKGLGFQLGRVHERLNQQSVATLRGPGQCVLQDCLATLAGAEGLRLAVITLANSTGVMMMENGSTRPYPDVDIQGCFIRGEGDLLTVRTSRPFALDVNNSLVVLRNGSLVQVEGTAEEAPAQTGSQAVTLQQVTAYLGDHLLSLKATRGIQGLVKTDVSTQNCLFASAGGKSLVHLEGMERDEVRQLLSWSSNRDQPNIYSGFTPMLDQQPRDQDTMLMPFDRDQWLGFTRESGDAFRRVQFSNAPAAEGSWSQAAVWHFQAKEESDVPPCGADLKTLARRFDESGMTPGAGND